MVKYACAFLSTLVISTSCMADLVNGGFEDFQTWGYGFFSGSDPTLNWATTAPDNNLEIWSDGFLGVPAYEGSSFAELNANYDSTLYQHVNGLGDFNTINWHFAHRGRYGVDVMQLSIIDLGADQLYGNGDDTVLYQGNFTADETAWQFHSGSIVSIGNLTRFAFQAVSATGGSTQGNFIDYCGFGVNAIPAPGAVSLIGIAGLCSFSQRKRK
jgi:hypothetical protein